MAKICLFFTLLFGSLVSFFDVCCGTNGYEPRTFDPQKPQWKFGNEDARYYFERPTRDHNVDERYVLNTDFNGHRATFSGPNELNRNLDDRFKYRSLDNNQLVTTGVSLDDNALSSGEEEENDEDENISGNASYDKARFASGDRASVATMDSKNDDNDATDDNGDGENIKNGSAIDNKDDDEDDDKSSKYHFKDVEDTSESQDDGSAGELNGLAPARKMNHKTTRDEDKIVTTINSDSHSNGTNLHKDYGNHFLRNHVKTKLNNYSEWTVPSNALNGNGDASSIIKTGNNPETISRTNLETFNQKVLLTPNASIAQQNYTQQTPASSEDKSFQGNEASKLKNEFPETEQGEGSSFNDLIKKYDNDSSENLNQESSGQGESGYGERFKTTDENSDSDLMNDSDNNSDSARINLDMVHQKTAPNGSIAKENDTHNMVTSGDDSNVGDQRNQSSSSKDYPIEGEGSSFDDNPIQDSSGIGYLSGYEETLPTNDDKELGNDAESGNDVILMTQARKSNPMFSTNGISNVSGNSAYPENERDMSSQSYSQGLNTSKLSSNVSHSSRDKESFLKQEEPENQAKAANMTRKKESSKMTTQKISRKEASGIIDEAKSDDEDEDISYHGNEEKSGIKHEASGGDQESNINNSGSEEGSGVARIGDISNYGNEEQSSIKHEASGSDQESNINNSASVEGSGVARIGDIINHDNEEENGPGDQTSGEDKFDNISNHGDKETSGIASEASGGDQIIDMNNHGNEKGNGEKDEASTKDNVHSMNSHGNEEDGDIAIEASGRDHFIDTSKHGIEENDQIKEVVSGHHVNDMGNSGSGEASGITNKGSGSSQISDHGKKLQGNKQTEEVTSGDQVNDIDNFGSDEASGQTDEKVVGDQINVIDNPDKQALIGLTNSANGSSQVLSNHDNIEASGQTEEAISGDQVNDIDNNGNEETSGLENKASGSSSGQVNEHGNKEASGQTEEAISGDQVNDVYNYDSKEARGTGQASGNGEKEASGQTDEPISGGHIIDNNGKASGDVQVSNINNQGNEETNGTTVNGESGREGTEASGESEEAIGGDKSNEISNNYNTEASGTTNGGSGDELVSDNYNHGDHGSTDETSGGNLGGDVDNNDKKASGMANKASGDKLVINIDNNHNEETSGTSNRKSSGNQVIDISYHDHNEGSGSAHETSSANLVGHVDNHGKEETSGQTNGASGDELVVDVDNHDNEDASGITNKQGSGDQVIDISNHDHKKGSGSTGEAIGGDLISYRDNHYKKEASGLSNEARERGKEEGSDITNGESGGGDKAGNINSNEEETSGLTSEASGDELVIDIDNHGNKEASGITYKHGSDDRVSDNSIHDHDEGSGNGLVSNIDNHDKEETSDQANEASGDKYRNDEGSGITTNGVGNGGDQVGDNNNEEEETSDQANKASGDNYENEEGSGITYGVGSGVPQNNDISSDGNEETSVQTNEASGDNYGNEEGSGITYGVGSGVPQNNDISSDGNEETSGQTNEASGDNYGNEEGSGITYGVGSGVPQNNDISSDGNEETSGQTNEASGDNYGNEEGSGITYGVGSGVPQNNDISSDGNEETSGQTNEASGDNYGNEEGSGITYGVGSGVPQNNDISSDGNEETSGQTNEASGDNYENKEGSGITYGVGSGGGDQIGDNNNEEEETSGQAHEASGDKYENEEGSGITYGVGSGGGDQVGDNNNEEEETSGQANEASGDNYENKEGSGITYGVGSGVPQNNDISSDGNEETSGQTNEASGDNYGNEEGSGITYGVGSGVPQNNDISSDGNEETSGQTNEASGDKYRNDEGSGITTNGVGNGGDQVGDNNNEEEETSDQANKASGDNYENEEGSGITYGVGSGVPQNNDISSDGNEETSGQTNEASGDNYGNEEGSGITYGFGSGVPQNNDISSDGNEETSGQTNEASGDNYGNEEGSGITYGVGSGVPQNNNINNNGNEEISGLIYEANKSVQVIDTNNNYGNKDGDMTNGSSGGDQVSDVSSHGYEGSAMATKTSGHNQVSEINNETTGDDKISDINDHDNEETSGEMEGSTIEEIGNSKEKDIQNEDDRNNEDDTNEEVSYPNEETSGLRVVTSGDMEGSAIEKIGNSKEKDIENEGHRNNENNENKGKNMPFLNNANNNLTEHGSPNRTRMMAYHLKLSAISGASEVTSGLKNGDDDDDDDDRPSGGTEVEKISTSGNYPENGNETDGKKEVEMEPDEESSSGHKTELGTENVSSGKSVKNDSKGLGREIEKDFELERLYNGSGRKSSKSASYEGKSSKNASKIVLSSKKEGTIVTNSVNVISDERTGNGSFSSLGKNTAQIENKTNNPTNNYGNKDDDMTNGSSSGNQVSDVSSHGYEGSAMAIETSGHNQVSEINNETTGDDKISDSVNVISHERTGNGSFSSLGKNTAQIENKTKTNDNSMLIVTAEKSKNDSKLKSSSTASTSYKFLQRASQSTNGTHNDAGRATGYKWKHKEDNNTKPDELWTIKIKQNGLQPSRNKATNESFSTPKVLLNNRTRPNVTSHQNSSSVGNISNGNSSLPGKVHASETSKMKEAEEEIFRNDHEKTKDHKTRKILRKKPKIPIKHGENKKVIKIATQSRFRSDNSTELDDTKGKVNKEKKPSRISSQLEKDVSNRKVSQNETPEKMNTTKENATSNLKIDISFLGKKIKTDHERQKEKNQNSISSSKIKGSSLNEERYPSRAKVKLRPPSSSKHPKQPKSNLLDLTKPASNSRLRKKFPSSKELNKPKPKLKTMLEKDSPFGMNSRKGKNSTSETLGKAQQVKPRLKDPHNDTRKRIYNFLKALKALARVRVLAKGKGELKQEMDKNATSTSQGARIHLTSIKMPKKDGRKSKQQWKLQNTIRSNERLGSDGRPASTKAHNPTVDATPVSQNKTNSKEKDRNTKKLSDEKKQDLKAKGSSKEAGVKGSEGAKQGESQPSNPQKSGQSQSPSAGQKTSNTTPQKNNPATSQNNHSPTLQGNKSVGQKNSYPPPQENSHLPATPINQAAAANKIQSNVNPSQMTSASTSASFPFKAQGNQNMQQPMSTTSIYQTRPMGAASMAPPPKVFSKQKSGYQPSSIGYTGYTQASSQPVYTGYTGYTQGSSQPIYTGYTGYTQGSSQPVHTGYTGYTQGSSQPVYTGYTQGSSQPVHTGYTGYTQGSSQPVYTGYSQASAGYNTASPGYTQGYAGYNQGSTWYNQASTGYSQEAAGYSQPSGYNYQGSSPGTSFESTDPANTMYIYNTYEIVPSSSYSTSDASSMTNMEDLPMMMEAGGTGDMNPQLGSTDELPSTNQPEIGNSPSQYSTPSQKVETEVNKSVKPESENADMMQDNVQERLEQPSNEGPGTVTQNEGTPKEPSTPLISIRPESSDADKNQGKTKQSASKAHETATQMEDNAKGANVPGAANIQNKYDDRLSRKNPFDIKNLMQLSEENIEDVLKAVDQMAKQKGLKLTPLTPDVVDESSLVHDTRIVPSALADYLYGSKNAQDQRSIPAGQLQMTPYTSTENYYSRKDPNREDELFDPNGNTYGSPRDYRVYLTSNQDQQPKDSIVQGLFSQYPELSQTGQSSNRNVDGDWQEADLAENSDDHIFSMDPVKSKPSPGNKGKYQNPDSIATDENNKPPQLNVKWIQGGVVNENTDGKILRNLKSGFVSKNTAPEPQTLFTSKQHAKQNFFLVPQRVKPEEKDKDLVPVELKIFNEENHVRPQNPLPASSFPFINVNDKYLKLLKNPYGMEYPGIDDGKMGSLNGNGAQTADMSYPDETTFSKEQTKIKETYSNGKWSSLLKVNPSFHKKAKVKSKVHGSGAAKKTSSNLEKFFKEEPKNHFKALDALQSSFDDPSKKQNGDSYFSAASLQKLLEDTDEGIEQKIVSLTGKTRENVWIVQPTISSAMKYAMDVNDAIQATPRSAPTNGPTYRHYKERLGFYGNIDADTKKKCAAIGKTTFQDSKCPHGWVPHVEFCYGFFDYPKTHWTAFPPKCATHNAMLAMPKTEEELGFITAHLRDRATFDVPYHIGLNKRKDTWNWVDDNPFSMDSNFNDLDVGATGDLNCGMIENGHIKASKCDKARSFVCEIKRGMEAVRILAFGDSLTRGYYGGGKEYHPYTEKLEYLLNTDSHKCFVVDNQGKDKEMAADMTKRLDQYLRKASTWYKWVIILGGTNDIVHDTRPPTEANYDRIVHDVIMAHQTAHKHGFNSIVVTIPEIDCEHSSKPQCEKIHKERLYVNQRLRHYARETSAAILSDLAGLLPRSSLETEKRMFYWEQGLHMKPQGYDRMAEIIYEDILRNN